MFTSQCYFHQHDEVQDISLHMSTFVPSETVFSQKLRQEKISKHVQ